MAQVYLVVGQCLGGSNRIGFHFNFGKWLGVGMRQSMFHIYIYMYINIYIRKEPLSKF